MINKVLALCAIFVPIVGSLSLPVSELLQKHSSTIGSIRQGGGTYSDLFYLRHILEFGEEEAAVKVQDTIAWRNGAGSNVVKRAGDAVTMATADGGWNNEPVLERAPHYQRIKPFITGKQILTTSTRNNDLIYCVRAGKIDDVVLMAEVSVEELEEVRLCGGYLTSKKTLHDHRQRPSEIGRSKVMQVKISL